jgi:hypothetical protein
LNAAAIRRCRWREPGGLAEALRIGAFLEDIGIAVESGRVGSSVIPGMTVVHGRVRVDPAVDAYPGDLLHEAGHVAVSDPATRATIEAIPVDPGDEMAAIAWSVAAANACGTALEALFFDDGYKGSAGALRTAFGGSGWVGVPLLAAYGMTAEPRRAAEWGVPAFPEMTRWLR